MNARNQIQNRKRINTGAFNIQNGRFDDAIEILSTALQSSRRTFETVQASSMSFPTLMRRRTRSEDAASASNLGQGDLPLRRTISMDSLLAMTAPTSTTTAKAAFPSNTDVLSSEPSSFIHSTPIFLPCTKNDDISTSLTNVVVVIFNLAIAHHLRANQWRTRLCTLQKSDSSSQQTEQEKKQAIANLKASIEKQLYKTLKLYEYAIRMLSSSCVSRSTTSSSSMLFRLVCMNNIGQTARLLGRLEHSRHCFMEIFSVTSNILQLERTGSTTTIQHQQQPLDPIVSLLYHAAFSIIFDIFSSNTAAPAA